jgi:UDP-glucuronate 4-epimerase
VLDRVPEPNPEWRGDAPDPATSRAPYRLYTIGNHRPVDLLCVSDLLEKALGREAQKNMLPMQPGDVPEACVD